jgi:hypothetical protein
MKFSRFIAFSIFCFSFAAYASSDSEWPEGSAMAEGFRHGASLESKIKSLKKSHVELLHLLTTKYTYQGVEHDDGDGLIKTVEAQQKAWNSYIKSECELIGVLGGGASAWQGTRSIECEQNLATQRLSRLRAAVRCIKRIAPEKRYSGQQQCLYQLAPLAVPLKK